jgi:N6-L-threonylcarbamoyladenine synthase
MEKLAEEKGWDLYLPDLSLCGDNGAMVGAQGYFEFLKGTIAQMDLNGKATADIEKDYKN